MIIEREIMRRKLELKEIKMKELDILVALATFCHSHHIRYYLSGGTLLGAIRHKGFIPWDDDIDICMPRRDYENFIMCFTSKNMHYEIKSMRLGNFNAPFSKVVDTHTTICSKYAHREIDSHLWVDVFPVDGLPNDIRLVKKLYRACDFYRKIYLVAEANLGEGKTTFRKYSKYILKPLANLYGLTRCSQKLETLAQTYEYDESEYVGAVTWGLYGAGERMKKDEFETSAEVEFEGHIFPTFSCWDRYLKGLYGDYMKLPPIEKRETHDMTVYMEE